MKRWTEALADRIRRTDFAGQLSIDGECVEQTVQHSGQRHEVEVLLEEQIENDPLPFDDNQ